MSDTKVEPLMPEIDEIWWTRQEMFHRAEILCKDVRRRTLTPEEGAEQIADILEELVRAIS